MMDEVDKFFGWTWEHQAKIIVERLKWFCKLREILKVDDIERKRNP